MLISKAVSDGNLPFRLVRYQRCPRGLSRVVDGRGQSLTIFMAEPGEGADRLARRPGRGEGLPA